MKKVITLVLVCVIVMTSFAVAENESGFKLRSGIEFGDTIEIIAEKEKSLTRTSDGSKVYEGRISGYDDATCEFFFDDDERLESMMYSFDCFSRDATNSCYDALYSGLVRKYGNPEGNTGGNCELITGPAITNMAFTVYLLGELDGYAADYYDYDEWIVDCAEYHVKIDIVSFYHRDDDFNYTYSVYLSYHKYTDEDYQEKIDAKKNERDEVDSDL